MRLAMKVLQEHTPTPPQAPPRYVALVIPERLPEEEALRVAMQASRAAPSSTTITMGAVARAYLVLSSSFSNGVATAFMGTQLALGAVATIFPDAHPPPPPVDHMSARHPTNRGCCRRSWIPLGRRRGVDHRLGFWLILPCFPPLLFMSLSFFTNAIYLKKAFASVTGKART
jgi:hypothetical protein